MFYNYVFQLASLYCWIFSSSFQYIGGRRAGGRKVVGRESKVDSSIHWSRKATIVCSFKYRKGHNVATCQAIGSSITPNVSLISAPQWHRSLSWIYKVTKMMPVKVDPAICIALSMVLLGSIGV